MIRVGIAQHQARNPGGIATYARGLVNGLGRVAGADVRVEPVAETRGPQDALSRLFWEQVRIPAAARRVDVLHMTDFRVPLQRSGPIVATVHDVGFITHPECFTRARRGYKRAAFTAMLAYKPDLIACDSSATLDTLRRVAPTVASRCRLLAPGVTPPPPDFRRAADAATLLTVGLAGPRKNIRGLLGAYQRARAAGLALDWVAVGLPGPGDGELVRAMRATEGITLAGHVSQAELERLWAMATMLAVPSVLEGFSYPVVEAMQRDVPVIASTGSGFDDSAGDAAWRVDPFDDAGWTEALLTLATDPAERRRLVELGRVQSQQFSWERRAPAFVRAYRSLLA